MDQDEASPYTFRTPRLIPPTTRSLEVLCAGITITGVFTTYEKALVLSCAQLSGFSAELISNTVYELFGLSRPVPEHVYDAHVEWEQQRSTRSMAQLRKSQADMARVLRQCGIKPMLECRRLSQTPRPKTVIFNPAWYPHLESKDAPSVFDSYSDQERQDVIEHFSWCDDVKSLTKPFANEKPICKSLGPFVTEIILTILRDWVYRTLDEIKTIPYSKKLVDVKKSWSNIKRYTNSFKRMWEKVYGTIADDHKNFSFVVQLPTPARALPIRSTGAAAKVFVSQMLANRLVALSARRQDWQLQTGYLDVPLAQLPRDSRECCICTGTLGEADGDNEPEIPIKVVACCGNIFGKACLERWYREVCFSWRVPTCPLCKARASPAFLNKLIGPEWEILIGGVPHRRSPEWHLGPVRLQPSDSDSETELDEDDSGSRSRDVEETARRNVQMDNDSTEQSL